MLLLMIKRQDINLFVHLYHNNNNNNENLYSAQIHRSAHGAKIQTIALNDKQ